MKNHQSEMKSRKTDVYKNYIILKARGFRKKTNDKLAYCKCRVEIFSHAFKFTKIYIIMMVMSMIFNLL